MPVPVRKLKPMECGHYWLAAAGAGNGDLIDGFIENLRLDAEGWQAHCDERVIREYIRNVLLDFHKHEVRRYPVPRGYAKLNYFVVCVKPKQSADIFLWEIRGSVILPADEYSLFGINEGIYKHEIRRMYDAGNDILTMRQAELLNRRRTRRTSGTTTGSARRYARW